MGAALAQVSGSFDQVVTNTPRQKALEDAKANALEEAIKAGASKDTVEIVDIAEIPLSYLPGRAADMP